MCERGTVLDRLAAMERAGSIVVNSPAAIRNTYRHRMIELFAQHHVSAPISQIVATDANKPRPADCAWVKRYDFHATQRDDVMYAASETGWREALRRIRRARHPVRHRSGACGWRSRQILWRPDRAGRRSTPTGSSGSIIATKACWAIRSMRLVCAMRRSARRPRSGLEIFGGDAIIRANGEPMIIDLNAWPSYALYRDRAARCDRGPSESSAFGGVRAWSPQQGIDP